MEKHNLENHRVFFKCKCCDFVSNIEGGLKKHIRRKHTNKMNPFHWKSCTLCNFNCKSDRDMETHISEFKITPKRRNNNEHIQQVDTSN